MLRPYKRLFVEKITKSDIDKLKKEFGMFTKNFSRIKSGKDLFTVHQSTYKWQNYVEEFIYSRLIGKQNKDKELEELRKKVWDIVVLLHECFEADSKIVFGNTYEIMVSEKERWNSQTEKAWNEIYEKWVLKKDSKYQKLTKIGREAFPLIYKFLDVSGGEVLDKKVRQDEIIDDVKVISYYIEDDEKSMRKLVDVKNALKKMIKIVKGTPRQLNKVLEGLVAEIDMSDKSFNEGGHYEYYTDRININGYISESFESSIYTFIHELGHRYETKFLPKENDKIWSDFIQENTYDFTNKDIGELKEAGLKASKKFSNVSRSEIKYESFGKEFFNTIKNPLLKLLVNISSQKKGASSQYLYAKNRGHEPKGLFSDSFFIMRDKQEWSKNTEYEFSQVDSLSQDDWNIWIDEIINILTMYTQISLGAVSGYANHSSEEAFAETFTFYILNYPMQPLTRLMFMKVCGLR